jgi:3-hydroxyisobutyrate dehydrogenase-like beta-hydroxyacid dehydrogenase
MAADVSDRPAVAVVGLGKMGEPIAERVLEAGFPLSVFNRTAARAEPLARRGATVLGSAREALARADVCVTSLADDGALDAVLLGEDGVLAGARPGTVLVEMSTVSVAASERVAERAEAAVVEYLRAPVSGNPTAVRGGTLTVVVSGPEQVAAGLDPLLRAIGPKVLYVGEGDSARVVKLVFQILIAGTAELLAEALVLGESAGVGREKLLEAINASAIGSPFVAYKSPPILRDYCSATFTTALMLKDVDLVLALAGSTASRSARAARADAARGDGRERARRRRLHGALRPPAASREPRPGRGEDWMTEPNANIASRGATMGVDWEQRVDFARLRAERLARAKAALEASDLGALLLFDPNNIRHVTSTHTASGRATRTRAALPRGEDPILWTSPGGAPPSALRAVALPENFRAVVDAAMPPRPACRTGRREHRHRAARARPGRRAARDRHERPRHRRGARSCGRPRHRRLARDARGAEDQDRRRDRAPRPRVRDGRRGLRGDLPDAAAHEHEVVARAQSSCSSSAPSRSRRSTPSPATAATCTRTCSPTGCCGPATRRSSTRSTVHGLPHLLLPDVQRRRDLAAAARRLPAAPRVVDAAIDLVRPGTTTDDRRRT